jgi:hypothetical protein
VDGRTHLREDQHAQTQYDGRYHLKTPWDAERRVAVDVRAPKLNEVLQEDAPCDGPLLHRDQTAADGGCSDLRLVQRNSSRGQTDSDTRDDTTCDEHSTVLHEVGKSVLHLSGTRKKAAYHCSALQDTADNPDPTGDDDDLLTPDLVCKVTDNERADERACGHGGDDCALGVRSRVPELVSIR